MSSMPKHQSTATTLWKQALLLYLVLTGLLGIAYPLFITLLAQSLFAPQANGSLVIRDGKIIGSALVGQEWKQPQYFHGRPSAVNYAADRSGAANMAVNSKAFVEALKERASVVRRENGLAPEVKIPADLVMTSASGLDPHISLEAALLQVPRVARARNLPPQVVEGLVKKMAEPSQFGLLGQKRVNVLLLNLALDQLTPREGSENERRATPYPRRIP